jgi:RNA polymerase sigma factor (TIGR02999 family)
MPTSGSSRDDDASDITELLQSASSGDREAFARVVSLVYDELGVLAHQRLRAERPEHTLNTTALVHEAYLKLAQQQRVAWRNREQFLAVASEAMRRILIDHARQRARAKRGDGVTPVPLDEEVLAAGVTLLDDAQADELLALDEALERLAAFNPEGARIVQFRFFGGLSNDEVATLTSSSERTVRRSWTAARAWLRRELGERVRDSGSFLRTDAGDVALG